MTDDQKTAMETLRDLTDPSAECLPDGYRLTEIIRAWRTYDVDLFSDQARNNRRMIAEAEAARFGTSQELRDENVPDAYLNSVVKL